MGPSIRQQLGIEPAPQPLRDAFLRWQCRVRQMSMRDYSGRPDDAIIPAVFIGDDAEPLGHIITILNKAPGYTVTPELMHMSAKTNDPAQRREQAIQFLSAAYYQRPHEFSDMLTATFPPGSPGAETIRKAERVRLVFDAYAQRFDLRCRVWRLAPHNPFHQATIAHNRLFNPAIPGGTEVLGFEPDWAASTADPMPGPVGR